MPKAKKPSVIPDRRRDWLHRFEVEAESPPAIAKKDSYDVRTVRKQIELARQERDVREAKLMVLRDAMVNHYKDLCNLAGNINSEVEKNKPISEGLTTSLICSALQQHIPRSVLWKNIERWNTSHQKLGEINGEIHELLRKKILSEPRLNFMDIAGSEQIILNLIEFFSFQIDQRVKVGTGLDIEKYFHIEHKGGQLHAAMVGAYNVGPINPEKEQEQASILKHVLCDFDSDFTEWEKSQELQYTYNELKNLRKSIREELDVITLRRVVPGRCKYCPL